MLDIKKTNLKKSSSDGSLLTNLEPHVEIFRVDESRQQKFTLPFQLMVGSMAVMLVMAFYFWFAYQDRTSVQIICYMQLLFAPFYIPGIYFYAKYYAKDTKSRLEIDSNNKLIQLESPSESLLFHADQVESCEIHMSLILPYQLHYTKLRLEGGKELNISNLLIEPGKLMKYLSIHPEVHQHAINVMPK